MLTVCFLLRFWWGEFNVIDCLVLFLSAFGYSLLSIFIYPSLWAFRHKLRILIESTLDLTRIVNHKHWSPFFNVIALKVLFNSATLMFTLFLNLSSSKASTTPFFHLVAVYYAYMSAIPNALVLLSATIISLQNLVIQSVNKNLKESSKNNTWKGRELELLLSSYLRVLKLSKSWNQIFGPFICLLFPMAASEFFFSLFSSSALNGFDAKALNWMFVSFTNLYFILDGASKLSRQVRFQSTNRAIQIPFYTSPRTFV